MADSWVKVKYNEVKNTIDQKMAEMQTVILDKKQDACQQIKPYIRQVQQEKSMED